MLKEECPYCGYQMFEEYRQGPEAVVSSKKRKGLIKERKLLNYEICKKCGTVKRIYVSLK